MILSVINKLAFLTFLLLKCIKVRSTKPLIRPFRFDPLRGANYRRRNPDLLGYQIFIRKKYQSILEENLSSNQHQVLTDKLFPDSAADHFRYNGHKHFFNSSDKVFLKMRKNLDSNNSKYKQDPRQV